MIVHLGMHPRARVYRSLFHGRLLDAGATWLLQHTNEHLVTACVPGAEIFQVAAPRAEVMRRIAAGRERIELGVWQSTRVVWLTRLGAPHAMDTSGMPPIVLSSATPSTCRRRSARCHVASTRVTTC